MISKATIDTIFETARVEEVIGDFLYLKRAGSNLRGLSPFSDEKSPSFMVSPVKQIWKDFSSGKGGNVVSFLMEHEHFTYPEALRYLAKKYNIELEETIATEVDTAIANEKESLFIVTEFAQKYFQQMLLETQQGKAIGLSYFKERGFTAETIKKFGLGYSPEQKDAFTSEALAKGYTLDFLEKSGLTIVSNNVKIDRFRGRVMFPIQSMSGRVLGFGGRILRDEKKNAKYLNSPESEIYYKSKVLYGIFQAKQSIAKNNHCYLVEGYTDVIQMHQAGIENVVSSSGTALTPDQIRLINRLTKNITVLYDGDVAGLRASIRGIDLILEQGMNVKICTFPEGDDPDSFARKTPTDDLILYLENQAQDFIQFKASLLMKESKNDPIKKAEVIRDMVESISKIPDTIKREIYVQECSKIMDISEEVLYNTLAQITQKKLKETDKKYKEDRQIFEVIKRDSPTEKVNILYELEHKIIEILVLFGNLTADFEDTVLHKNEKDEFIETKIKKTQKVFERIFLSLQEDEIELTNPKFRAIYNQLIDYFQQHETIEIESFIMPLAPEIAQEITTIIMENEQQSLHNWEAKNVFVKLKETSIEQYVLETILSLRWYLVQQLINEFKNSITPETTDTSAILSNIIDYQKLVHLFSKKLGRVLSVY